ncbi:MAG: hypothetical protein WA089_10720, partial [Anaerolineae bacterium]
SIYNPDAERLTLRRVNIAMYQDIPSIKGWRADQILNVLFSLSELRDPETERNWCLPVADDGPETQLPVI